MRYTFSAVASNFCDGFTDKVFQHDDDIVLTRDAERSLDLRALLGGPERKQRPVRRR